MIQLDLINAVILVDSETTMFGQQRQQQKQQQQQLQSFEIMRLTR